MESVAFRRQMAGYGLTTASILYRLPDHPRSCRPISGRTTIWPRAFPSSIGSCEFWRDKIEGALHSVTVTHCGLIKPAELRTISGEFRVH